MTDSTPAVSEALDSLKYFSDDRAAVLRRVELVRAHIADLTRQLADARRDAERYRWLRSDDVEEPEYSVFRCSGMYPTGEGALIESALDAAIDAAMSGGTGE